VPLPHLLNKQSNNKHLAVASALLLRLGLEGRPSHESRRSNAISKAKPVIGHVGSGSSESPFV
jgi:hypothetical protein